MHKLKVLICIIPILILSGCWDYNELNMQALVGGVGVSTAGDTVRVSVVCSPDGEQEPPQVYSGQGKSFFDAVRAISGSSDKKLYWGHCEVIVLDEASVLRSEDIFDTMLRAQDVYLDIEVVLLRGKSAASLIEEEAEAKNDVSEMLSKMFANEKNSRRFKSAKLNEIFRGREKHGCFILPVAEYAEGKMSLTGGAVIKNNKVAAYLTGEQMLALSLITDSGAGGYTDVIACKNGSAAFEILGSEAEIKREKESIRIKQSVVLSPGEVSGNVNNKELEAAAKRYFDAELSLLAEYVIEKDVEEIMGFGEFDGAIETETEIKISNIFGGGR